MRSSVFIDASNLFYGFDREYGWKIDYARLKIYLENKYEAQDILYFGGIDTSIGLAHEKEYQHDYSESETVSLNKYIFHFEKLCGDKNVSETQEKLVRKLLQQAKFYSKLESFGYSLFLKPVKSFGGGRSTYPQRKANCDVDLTLHTLIRANTFDRAIMLSGDGDFLPLYKHLEKVGKEVLVLSRTKRTAREVKRHMGARFLEIRKLQKQIEFLEI